MYWYPVLRIHDVYDVHPGSRFRFFPSRIPDPGSRFDKIPDPGSVSDSKNFSTHKTHITDTLYSKIRSGMFIPDPGSWIWIFFHSWSRIRISDPGIKKAPDPGSATLAIYVFLSVTEGAANFNFLKIITRDSQMKPVATQKGRPRKCKPKHDHLEI